MLATVCFVGFHGVCVCVCVLVCVGECKNGLWHCDVPTEEGISCSGALEEADQRCPHTRESQEDILPHMTVSVCVIVCMHTIMCSVLYHSS